MENRTKRNILKLFYNQVDNNIDSWIKKKDAIINKHFLIIKCHIHNNSRQINGHDIYVLYYNENNPEFVGLESCSSILRKWVRKTRKLEKYLQQKQKEIDKKKEKECLKEKLNFLIGEERYEECIPIREKLKEIEK